jgi:hypothetical protein
MSVIYPPSSFYTGPNTNSPLLDIAGVNIPLQVRSGQLRLFNSDYTTIWNINTDPLLADDDDEQLVTQHAVKTYIDSGIIGALTAPITLHSLTPYQIEFKQTGGIPNSTIGHNIAEEFEINSATTVRIAATPKVLIDNPTDVVSDTDASLVLAGGQVVTKDLRVVKDTILSTNLYQYYDPTHYSTSTVSALGYQTVAASGGWFKTATGTKFEVLDTADQVGLSAPLMTQGGGYIAKKLRVGSLISGTTMELYSTSSPQLKIAYSGSYYVTISVDAAGDTTIDAVGNDLNFHSSDVVHVLNTTASTSPITGALLVSGGIGISDSINAAGTITGTQLRGITNALSQLYLENSTGFSVDFTVDPSGYLTIGTTGGKISTAAASPLNVLDTTAASSTTTGALIISGGVGIAGNTYIGGNVYAVEGLFTRVGGAQLQLTYNGSNYAVFTVGATGDLTIDTTGNDLNFHSTDSIHVLNTTASTSTITGALVTSGGIGCADGMYMGGNLVNQATTASTTYATGAVVTSGGLGVAGAVNTNSTLTSAGVITGYQLKGSNSATSQLLLEYGVGVNASLTADSSGYLDILASGNRIQTNAACDMRVLNTTDSTSTTTGALIVTGGIGCAKNVTCDTIRWTGVTKLKTIQWQLIDGVDAPAFELYGGGALPAYTYTPIANLALFSTVQLPLDRLINGSVSVRIHWFPETGTAGDVLWRLIYRITEEGSAHSTSGITVDQLIAGPGTTYEDTVTTFSLSTGALASANAVVQMSLSRMGADATDTYAYNAYLVNAELQYTSVKPGA